jgi:hypothetical protein
MSNIWHFLRVVVSLLAAQENIASDMFQKERKMSTFYKTCVVSTGPRRGVRSHRVLRPMAGQAFEIEIHHDGGWWVIRIPEINEVTEAASRPAVELAARECIAAHTGIPIGYISVWMRD